MEPVQSFAGDVITDMVSQEHFEYANFGTRLLALLIDSVVLIIPNIILFNLFRGTDLPALYFISELLVSWLYYAIQESGPGQATLGKKALNIRVVDLQGNRISFGRASGRYFGKLLSSCILLIGYLMNIWDDQGQTLHDKLAGCLVIKNNPHLL